MSASQDLLLDPYRLLSPIPSNLSITGKNPGGAHESQYDISVVRLSILDIRAEQNKMT